MTAKKPSGPRKLATYRAKRDFQKTGEPAGVKSAKATHSSYLIQKHAARRLHYDFRLEMNGVLKSWAVTRGPSLNPADKRLAVHVEDHPLDYGSFEGTIPKGQYGGGTVMLWDQGDWEPVGDAERSYKKGNLTFELHGKRLKGRWHLVRMHGKGRNEKHENWLLIKGKDQYANEDDGDYALERYQKSVTTNRSMSAIAGSKEENGGEEETERPTPKRTIKKTSLKKAKTRGHGALPDFIPPQLATLVSEPPKGEKWVHEIKFDGYRLLAFIENGKVRLVTRANNDWTAKFKGLAEALAALSTDKTLLDGEAVSMEDDGTMSFHGLQHALSTGAQTHLHYYAFDILYLDGEDCRARPLLERKKSLKKLLEQAPPNIHYSEHFTEPGTKVLNHACHIALEGIVSKRADAPYYSGRNDYWLKSKCHKEQEAVIGGYTLQPKHAGFLGAMLTGYHRKNEFIFSGKVGTGFSHTESRILLKKLQGLQRKTSPFQNVPADARRGALWVEPELVAQIQFTEWTEDGRMRHPSFKGLREDKPAQEVVREKAMPVRAVVASKTPPASNKQKESIAGIPLSHPDKILYPDSGITKRDLALYYEKVAPLMLPHVAGRPISLMRCPGGAGKSCFFQRHASDGFPQHIKQFWVKGGDKQPYLMIEDIRGLITLVQMDALEIHVWGSRADNPEKPDRLVFDLDPSPEVPFAAVKKAANETREYLKTFKLLSFLKTTGGKGLHIVVPFQKGPSWDQAKTFSRDFAQAMAKNAPDRFTINSRKNVRTNKIFIDYLRNGEGASAIAPYSTRAREGAPVAVPIGWDELPGLKSGHTFTMQTALDRLKNDPWKNLLTVRQKLPA